MTTVTSGPIVTIAMPVFNGGSLLRVALESLLLQTFEDWELLLIDDGSTDGAFATLPADLDPRICIISDGRNLGLAARLNEALDLARGSYFARMDHDDIAHPDRLKLQVAYMESSPSTDLLGTKCVAMSEGGQILGEFPFRETHAQICRQPWVGFYLPHPSWLGRTQWFRQYRYADPAPYRCEDQDLLLRAHANSTYHALDKALLAYRLRDKVRPKTLLWTRLSLAQFQLVYFWHRRAVVDLLRATAVTVLRITKDLLAPPSIGHRPEVAGEVSNQELVEWQNLVDRVSTAASRGVGHES